MGWFFKSLQNLLKFKEKFWKLGDFAQNWAKWYMNGSLFLENLVFVWSTFKIHSGTSLPKPNLNISPTPGTGHLIWYSLIILMQPYLKTENSLGCELLNDTKNYFINILTILLAYVAIHVLTFVIIPFTIVYIKLRTVFTTRVIGFTWERNTYIIMSVV